MRAKFWSNGLQAVLLLVFLAVSCAWGGPANAQALERAAPGVIAPPATDPLGTIMEAGRVRIAVPEDLPPFGSRGDDGMLQGYDIEVATLLAEDLGVQLELVPVTSVNRIPSLLTRQADLVIANLGVNPERAKSIAFSTPYAPFYSGVFGAPDVDVKGPRICRARKSPSRGRLSKISNSPTCRPKEWRSCASTTMKRRSRLSCPVRSI